jgi:hypothetical protein
MAGTRCFAALIDQDSVVVIEYQQEKSGFRLLDTRSRNQRFASPEKAADAVVELLSVLKAKSPRVSIVLQHFGSFFHTLVLPPAAPEHLRPIIQREVQRSFNIPDPVVSFSAGTSVERRATPRAEGQAAQAPRQIFIAGAPRAVVEAIQARLQKARVRVEGLTVVPDVFRRLYDALDGSNEATALLICLQNGPHVAFFVNGQLELAMEPPLALEGEAPLDTTVIIDQLERGAIFLRQQARGTVATRLLLSAPAADHESLASTIEARTGMHVAGLGQGIGTPESVVAMGAVLASRGADRLDLYPRPPEFDERLKTAMSGPGLVTSALLAAAAVAAFWAGMQVLKLSRERASIENVQAQVARAVPIVANARQSAQGRERIASIRTTLREATIERSALADLMSRISTASQTGTHLDSLRITRVADGLRTTLFCRATATTGPAAMSAATGFYRHFRTTPGLKELEFESAYVPRGEGAIPTSVDGEDLRFTVSFVAPAGSR